MGNFCYSRAIATDAHEAIRAYRMYRKPATILTWSDGREELIEGEPREVAAHVAECLEADGVSAEFSVRPATTRDFEEWSEKIGEILD